MDVKPVFAVAVVACCMAFSFMLKVYTNQRNVTLFGAAETQKLVGNDKQVLTDYFIKVKADATTIRLSQQSEKLATRAFLVKLFVE